ncbi:MAG: fluoride efflux transporter CrcB [Bacteroidetes bacterium]|nr:fluoride efflux transporter CrcB [Bacteroidota bacterium]
MNYAILFVFLGGGMGSILRYYVGRELNPPLGLSFPIGTLLVNLAGSLLIGLLWGITEKSNDNNSSVQLLLITGFCGGFTTLSALSQETFYFIKTGNLVYAIGYSCATILGGVLLTALSYKIVTSL